MTCGSLTLMMYSKPKCGSKCCEVLNQVLFQT